MTTPAPGANLAWQNFYSTTLRSSITSGTLTIPVNTPAPLNTEGFLVIDWDVPASREVIWYTSRASGVGIETVTCPSNGRGYDGTTAVAHSSGANVIMAPIGAMFVALQNGNASTDPARAGMLPATDYANTYIISGGVVAAVSGLNVSISDLVFSYNGKTYTASSISNQTMTNNATSYIYAQTTTTLNAVIGVTTSPSTGLNFGKVLLAVVTTSGGAVTTISTKGVYTGVSSSQHPARPIATYSQPVPTWFSYTPTLANMTLGNGTLVGKYKRFGNTVTAHIRFVLGSTSAVGTSPTLTLPFAADSTTYDASKVNIVGNVYAEDSGVAGYFGPAMLSGSLTTVTPEYLNVAGTYANPLGYTATVPFTWGSGDYFDLTITYECSNDA